MSLGYSTKQNGCLKVYSGSHLTKSLFKHNYLEENKKTVLKRTIKFDEVTKRPRYQFSKISYVSL